jgi:hypothetical protein
MKSGILKKFIVSPKKGAHMNGQLLLKITVLSVLALVVTGSTKKLVCMDNPRAELAVYQAAFQNLSNQDLVLRYRQEFESLRNSFKSMTAGNPTLDQLPIFRLAVFKALLAEIKKRENKIINLYLLPTAEQQTAEMFIKTEEGRMKAGIETEKRSSSK